MEENKISVILCTKNRAISALNTIRSIAEQSLIPKELIIIDSSNTRILQKQTQKFYDIFKSFIYCHLNDSKGLTEARNVGLEKSGGEIISFLDDDVILDKSYYKIIYDDFCHNSEIFGLTGNHNTNYNILNDIFHKFFLLNSSGDGTIMKSGFGKYISCSLMEKEKLIPVKFLHGFNMNFKKEVFRYFSFNEHFNGYSYMEDVEFSYRVGKKYKLYLDSSANVYHHHNPSGREGSEKLTEMLLYNHYYFFKNIFEEGVFLAFLWAHFGLCIKMFIKYRSFSGLFNGWKKILLNKKSGK